MTTKELIYFICGAAALVMAAYDLYFKLQEYMKVKAMFVHEFRTLEILKEKCQNESEFERLVAETRRAYDLELGAIRRDIASKIVIYCIVVAYSAAELLGVRKV